MDINKDSYTFGFAAIMVIIVTALLSGSAILLKDPQERNVELEKKQNILKSVGIESFIISKNNSKFIIIEDTISAKKNDTIFIKKSGRIKVLNPKGKYIDYKDVILISREMSEMFYPRFIKKELVINNKGEIQEGTAFDVELTKEIKKDISEQKLPLYIADVEGETKYIIPEDLNIDHEDMLKKFSMFAHKSLGCKGVTRSDFIIPYNNSDEPILLEINTLPGLTKHSLVPKIAKNAGIDFDSLIEMIIKDALI